MCHVDVKMSSENVGTTTPQLRTGTESLEMGISLFRSQIGSNSDTLELGLGWKS